MKDKTVNASLCHFSKHDFAVVRAEVFVQKFIHGSLLSYEGFFFGAMVSKSFGGLYKFPLLVDVCLHERHVSLAFFFFLPEKLIKIHVGAISKGPENHLEHFVAIFLSKTGLPESGDSNFS